MLISSQLRRCLMTFDIFLEIFPTYIMTSYHLLNLLLAGHSLSQAPWVHNPNCNKVMVLQLIIPTVMALWLITSQAPCDARCLELAQNGLHAHAIRSKCRPPEVSATVCSKHFKL
jgi:hypothetical protein